MQINHSTIASFARYSLISLASSAVVQAAAIWPSMKLFLVIAIAVIFFYFVIFCVRYYGMFTGKRWAYLLRIDHLDKGLIEFATFISFALVGGLPTWLMYLT